MKLRITTIIILFLSSCQFSKEKTGREETALSYQSKPAESAYLITHCEMEGKAENLGIAVKLNITNVSDEDILVKNIILSTPEGLRSIPVNGQENNFLLGKEKDTLIALEFEPLNDLNLYQFTGKRGLLKPNYNLLFSYKKAGSEEEYTADLEGTLPEQKYKEYKLSQKSKVEPYLFSDNEFAEGEKKHLLDLKLSDEPFVYLSEQEIAVAGLNFRLKSYSLKDTLYAELLVVNHAEFAIKVDTTFFGFTHSKLSLKERIISMQKISGPVNENNILRKGDRAIIRLKQYLKPGWNKKGLALGVKHSIFLGSGNPLFYKDIKLEEKSLDI